MKTNLLVMLGLCAAGCGAAKPAADDQFTSLAGVDEKSDVFSSRLKLLGALTFDKPVTARYSKAPYYRAFELAPNEGDVVDLWVRSTHGDPVTWLVDDQYRIVAKNDDADANTTDSHIRATLHGGVTYRVIFRDYAWETHYFTVAATRQSAACDLLFKAEGNTELGGLMRQAGGSFDYHLLSAPLCFDFSTAAGQAAILDRVNRNGYIKWDNQWTKAGAWQAGNGDFLRQLDRARDYIQEHADAFSSPDDQEALARLDEFYREAAAPSAAPFELTISIEADECSEEAVLLIDAHGHTLRIIHQGPLC